MNRGQRRRRGDRMYWPYIIRDAVFGIFVVWWVIMVIATYPAS